MQSARLRYLVAYDICETKRLQRTHKKVEAYAVGGQKSFYECWLTVIELEEFQEQLLDLIEEEEDKIFIFQIQKNTEPLLFGKAHLQDFNQPFLVI